MEQTVKLLQNKNIAIVGGGPGGLTLARLLQLKGATVKVYERDASQAARVQGAIVDLHFDTGLKVIKAAGLFDAFKVSYMSGADKYRLVDKDAKILLDEHTAASVDDFKKESFRPEIDRGALRDLLIASLLPGTVVWDSKLDEIEQVGGSWRLKFSNGTSADADLVIGCDGHRSKIRRYVTPIQPLYSGATIIQGEIDEPQKECPEIFALLNQANLLAMDIGKTIAVQPRGDGGITFYAESLYPENWINDSGINFNDPIAVVAYLTDFYHDWDQAFIKLFKACKQFVPRPLNYFPPDQYWQAHANITLLGDAAHLMPPSGEGVNTAMLDALDLSNSLTDERHADLRSAIAAYEDIMRSRASVLAVEAVKGSKDLAAPSRESIDNLIAMFTEGWSRD